MTLPTREEALSLLREYITTEYTLRHSLATEAIMRGLARKLDQDPDLWGITGLLHDLDLELVGEDMHRHARRTVEILREKFDFSAEGLQAILAHNGDILDIPCRTDFDNALTAAESITGLIFATSLVYPSKKIADVKLKSVKKRMKEPRFAAKVSRQRIRRFEHLPLTDQEFYQISLDAMKAIGSEIGL